MKMYRYLTPVLMVVLLSGTTFAQETDGSGSTMDESGAESQTGESVDTEEKKVEIKWDQFGFQLIRTGQENEHTSILLRDREKHLVTIIFHEDIDKEQIERIQRLNESFLSWRSMKIYSARYEVNENGEIEVLIVPSSYNYKNTDIQEYLSTGLFFKYNRSLQYNFRIAVNKMFVAIKGSFIDETSFNEKMFEAINDPVSYVNSRDPENLYETQVELVESIQILRAATMAYMNGGKRIDDQVVQTILTIKDEHPGYTYKEIYNEMKESGTRVSTNEIKIVLAVYKNEY